MFRRKRLVWSILREWQIEATKAAQMGRPETVDVLLDFGASVNAVSGRHSETDARLPDVAEASRH